MSIARALLVAGLAALTACSEKSLPAPPPGDCTIAGCPAGQSCNPDTRSCVAASPACGGGCPSGSVCNPATSTCTAGSCSATTCPTGTCIASACHVCGADVLCPAAGAACGTAGAITLASGTTTLMGSFGGLPYGLVSSTYRTAVVRLEVQEETILSATMSARSSAIWPAEYELAVVRSDCDSRVGVSVAASGGEAIADRYLAPGTYYLWISGDDVASSWLVTLQAAPATQPAGNSCSAPLPLVWNATTGAVAIHGSTLGNDQATWNGCGYGGYVAPDVVYRLDLAVASFVNLHSTQAQLQLATDCLAEHACGGYFAGGSPLAAGTYYVVASTGIAPGRAFDIDGTVAPWAPNASCQTAAPLDLSSGAATVTGNMQYADTGTSVACASGDTLFGILDYALSTAGLGDQSLDVEVTRPGGGATYGVALHRACEPAALADVVACTPGQPSGASARLSVDVLPAGAYWLSLGDYVGPFSMTVARGPPRYALPANDTCAAPAAIAIASSATYTLTGDTRGADDTVGGACGGTDPGAGKDVAYRATYSSRGWLTLRVTPSASLDAVLRVDPGCTGAPAGACANAAGPGGAEQLVLPITSGTETAFWVDGAGGTAGTFSVSAQLKYASSYDVCENVTMSSLSPGQVIPDDLRNAFADGAGACAAAGPDVFYAYQNTGNGPQNVSFEVVPTNFDVALRVLSSCAETTCPALVDAAGPGGAETTPTVKVASNERVFVQITTAGAGGAFTVTAKVN